MYDIPASEFDVNPTVARTMKQHQPDVDTTTLVIDYELSGLALMRAAATGKEVVCLTENTAGIVIRAAKERLEL